MSRARTQQSFQTIRSEGGLLPIDILQRIAAQDKELPGLTSDAYHLPPGGRFGEAVSGAWSRVLASWRNFQEALARLPENDPATTLTREKFLLPLFEELKFGRLPKKTSSFEVDGRSYAISHEYHRSPIHMLGCRVSLEERVAGLAGAAKSSPHGLVQDLLNRSEQHLWGFVTNGLLLRILRDHHSLTQQAYVEFDLQAMLRASTTATLSCCGCCVTRAASKQSARKSAGSNDGCRPRATRASVLSISCASASSRRSRHWALGSSSIRATPR